MLIEDDWFRSLAIVPLDLSDITPAPEIDFDPLPDLSFLLDSLPDFEDLFEASGNCFT